MTNIYYYDTNQSKSVSLREHVEENVLKLMLSVGGSEINKKSKKKNNLLMVSSGESENESSNENEQTVMFKKIIADYADRSSSFSKTIKRASDSHEEKNQYKRFAMVFRELELLYLDESETAKKSKRLEYFARAIFAKIGQMSLRNCNSSSVTERSFSDCLRSCDNRKSKKRNVLKSR